MTVPGSEFASDNAADFQTDEIEDIYPANLRERGPEGGGALAPDFGGCSWFNVPVAGVNALPVQILQRRPLREQAWVRNLDANDFVVIAESFTKLQQAVPQGYIIPPGAVEKVESQQAYWAVVLPAGAGLAGVSPASTSIQSITVPTPALGAPMVYTLPVPMQINAVTFLYAAGATVVTRFPVLQVKDGSGNIVAQAIFAGSGILANTNDRVFSAIGTQLSVAPSGSAYTPFPALGVLPAGYQIVVTVIDGTDQISQGFLQVVSSALTAAAPLTLSVRDEAWAENDDQHAAIHSRQSAAGIRW